MSKAKIIISVEISTDCTDRRWIEKQLIRMFSATKKITYRETGKGKFIQVDNMEIVND